MYLENQVDVKKHRQGGAGKGGGFLCVKAVLGNGSSSFCFTVTCALFSSTSNCSLREKLSRGQASISPQTVQHSEN